MFCILILGCFMITSNCKYVHRRQTGEFSLEEAIIALGSDKFYMSFLRFVSVMPLCYIVKQNATNLKLSSTNGPYTNAGQTVDQIDNSEILLCPCPETKPGIYCCSDIEKDCFNFRQGKNANNTATTRRHSPCSLK